MIPPGDAGADDWLGQELARGEYWQLWWPLLVRRVTDLFGDDALGSGAQSLLVVLVVLLLVLLVGVGVAVGAAMARRRRARAGPAAPTGGVFGGAARLDAAAYRRRASEHAAAGRHAEALLDAYRALSAQATERGLVADAPDLTAADVTRALAGGYAADVDEIVAAQRLFDEVRYGGAPADADDARRVGALDAHLAVTAPTPAPPGAVPALPTPPR